jgi:integrase/recombinase XerD
MNEGYIPHFKMQEIKVDKNQIETYNEAELKLLLKKPNLKKCSFTEYKCWVMTNFLFSTGVRPRRRSLQAYGASFPEVLR